MKKYGSLTGMKKVLGMKKTLKNSKFTSKEVIVDQLNEPRPLPLGRKEFEEWSDRLIAGACLPTAHLKDDECENFIESQKCTLAGMVLHLGPTESHKEDAFFIHSLRKAAANEVAHEIGTELRNKTKERLKAKEESMMHTEGLSERD